MNESRRVDIADIWPPALLMLLSAGLICFRLGSYSLVNGDEAIYHAIAQQMVASGDWLTLDFKGENRVWDTLMNAPIQYWARAAAISVFGDSLWTARILSALCGVAGIAMTYRLVLHLSNRRTAFAAGVVQLTTLQFVYLHSARTGELDAALSLLITATAYQFIRAVEGRRSFVAHHLCLVLILNLKTFTVAIPLIAELCCFALLPALRPRLRDWLLCSAWMLPLGLAWHATQIALLFDPIVQVVEEMGSKAAGELGLAARIWSNTTYYASTLLFGAFPWALVYPLALAGAAAPRHRDSEGWRWTVLLIFIAALFAFYLPIAERNRWYVVPAYPLLAALVARWFFALAARRSSLPELAGLALVASLALCLEVGATSFNPFAEQANRIAMETRWRSLPVAPLAALALAATALTGLGVFVRSRFPAADARLQTALLALLLFGIGSLRVASPFAFLGHQSEMAQIRQRIDASRAAGREPTTPIQVGEPLGGRARFYFADDFDLVPVRSRSKLPNPIFFRLVEKRDGAPDH